MQALRKMEGLVRRKTNNMVSAVGDWFKPFKIPEDPNKPFMQRWREHVESLREERKTDAFKIRNVQCTTRSLRLLMAFQAPTMIYVYMAYIVPHTFEDYSLWTQFYMKLACWYVLFMGLSSYLLVIFTDPSANKIKHRLDNEMSRVSSENNTPIQTNGADTYTDLANGHSVYNIGEQKEVLTWGFCNKCNIYMPPRAHHCMHCDVCVLKRDHHCNMVGNCVGFNNQRFFIVLTFYAIITGILGAFFTMKYIREAMWPTMDSWTDLFLPVTIIKWLFGSLPGIQALLTLHVYLEIPFGLFGIMYFTGQIMHVFIGLTPYEVEKNLPLQNINGPRYSLRCVFGKYWALNFVFPVFLFFKELDDGIRFDHIKFDQKAYDKAKNATEGQKESLEPKTST